MGEGLCPGKYMCFPAGQSLQCLRGDLTGSLPSPRHPLRRALADCRHGAQVLPSSHDCLAVSPWVGADVAGRGGQLACGSLHLSRPVLSCEALKRAPGLRGFPWIYLCISVVKSADFGMKDPHILCSSLAVILFTLLSL